MSIEQYFGGRIRYNIQVGDNGDSQQGVGCYAKSPGILGQDIAEIRKRYIQYLSVEENSNGKKPTIYKRAVLPTGTILITACSYIPPRSSDRPIWIDHSYLVRGDDPAALDPEKWIGLPYRTDDPNPVWEDIPEGIMERIRNGEVYRTDKWIKAESLTNFPKSNFKLLPLTDVLKMWGLENDEMVDLVEAAMDCVAAPDQGGRKLFIKYDIDAKDCLNSKYWDHSLMNAEQFNRYRMSQLLAWIYHLIPFSFRRLLGYDTMLDANAGYHHIIFVTESRIRAMGNGQYCYTFPSYDGTNLIDNKNTMMTGGGYLYDPARGIWHDSAVGQKNYRELYQTEGIIQNLISEEVSRYIKARTMDEIHYLFKDYNYFFEQLETHIPIFSNSIAELESEIPRWKATLVADPEDLMGMAITLLNRSGKEDISQNLENEEYFRHIVSALKAKTTDENMETVWLPVLEFAVTRAPFKDQLSFVDELVDVILSYEDPLGKFEQYSAKKEFNEAVIEGKKLIGWLFCDLIEDERFKNDWLALQYKDANDYASRLSAYESTNRQFYEMTKGLPKMDELHAINEAYFKTFPLLTDSRNIKSLLTLPINNEKTANLAEQTAWGLVENFKILKIYNEVLQGGPATFVEFRNSVWNSKMGAAAALNDRLLQVVFDEWLAKYNTKRLSPKELGEIIGLLLEYSADDRFEDWRDHLTEILSVRANSPYNELTADEFSHYLNAVTGTDAKMVKIACRDYLFCHVLVSLEKGTVIAGKGDLKILSEYLTSEKKYEKGCAYPQMFETISREGIERLIKIITAQVKAEGSFEPAAKLFNSLSDDNVLNCEQTLNELLVVSGGITDAIEQSGKANEEDIRIFENAFKWWESDPRVRSERRKIVRAADYRPTFIEIRNAVENPSRLAFEKLSDDGFIYDIERYNLNSLDSVIKTMARRPASLSTSEWIDYYCDLLEEAFRTKNLGKLSADYPLLDVMCEVVLRDGIADIRPSARVNYEWMKSLSTNGFKVDKTGASADSLNALLKVKDVCEQLSSSKAKKIAVDDPTVNAIVTDMIGDGKVYIRLSGKALDALCKYLEKDDSLLTHILYEWRIDRIIKTVEAVCERSGEQFVTHLQSVFNRYAGSLSRVYTDEEMNLIGNAFGIKLKTAKAQSAAGEKKQAPKQNGKNAKNNKPKKGHK